MKKLVRMFERLLTQAIIRAGANYQVNATISYNANLDETKGLSQPAIFKSGGCENRNCALGSLAKD